MKKTMMKMPVNVAKQVDPAEAWVQNRAPESGTVVQLAQPVEPMKRFTIDVSESLHKRIKMQCAARGQKMADVIRELLDKEFPEGKGV
jgi:predicted DNA binding CopG/RHH family protein